MKQFKGMSQFERWMRGVVLLGAVGVGGSFAWNEVAAWQEPEKSQAASVPKSAKVVRVRQEMTLDPVLEPLVVAALSDDAKRVAAATDELRRGGQRSLDYVMTRTQSAKMEQWKTLVDAVAQQRDARFSGLFWHTDLAAAQEVAQREGKPILSLRLLGNLTDELSCANSRFFRTTLYPHAAVRSTLATKYVLHWESVRAVPIITIDFGDGRSIKRTITGNSLHLVLDARGRTVDVLPGLYGAGFFARVLQQSESVARKVADLDDVHFKSEMVTFHMQQLRDQQTRWSDDWKQLGAVIIPKLGAELDDASWSNLAQKYQSEVAFDGMTMAAVQSKQTAEAAGPVAMAKMVTETAPMRLLKNLVPVVGQDTVKNEYKMHRQLHQWLQEAGVIDRDALVSRIYGELFLSPLNDPWYGLSKPDVYSAVENDGRHNAVSTTQNARR